MPREPGSESETPKKHASARAARSQRIGTDGVGPQTESRFAQFDFIWRHSTRDGVYGPSSMLVRPAGNSRARYLASLGASWELAPVWSSSVIVAYSEPGPFLGETGADDPRSHISLKLQYRF